MNGFLFIDKEKGCTSFDVIRKLKPKIKGALCGGTGVGFARASAGSSRSVGNKIKVGHSGTLDPIATGLMIIALGEATKLLEFLLDADKVYRASCRFGAVSDTYDADGSVEEVLKAKKVSINDIKKIFDENFTGEIDQVPPRYSAKKIDGKRACDLARKGEKFELKSKKVKIYDFSFISFEWPNFDFEISCGSGTYVRSLVHDLGQKLGCGAYMTDLRRTEIGFFDGGLSRGFSVDEALKVDDVNFGDEGVPEGSNGCRGPIHSIEEVFSKFPTVDINTHDYNRLKNGGFILNTKSVRKSCILARYNGKVIGVLEAFRDEKFVKLKKRINIFA